MRALIIAGAYVAGVLAIAAATEVATRNGVGRAGDDARVEQAEQRELAEPRQDPPPRMRKPAEDEPPTAKEARGTPNRHQRRKPAP